MSQGIFKGLILSLIKPNYNSYKNGLGTKFEKVDNKVLKMMKENPGFSN